MDKAFVVQILLLGFYALLTILFGFKKPTWPLAVYYLGCLIKDGAVMALALWKTYKP